MSETLRFLHRRNWNVLAVRAGGKGVFKTEKLIEMYEAPDGWMALRKNPFCGRGMLLIGIKLLVFVRGGKPDNFLEKE